VAEIKNRKIEKILESMNRLPIEDREWKFPLVRLGRFRRRNSCSSL
jgi:hypothetical protein